MALSPQLSSLKARIDSELAGRRLNAWQRSFLTGIAGRVEKYGSDTRLSEKQLRKLREIIGDDFEWPLQRPVRLLQFPKSRKRRRQGNRTVARVGRRLIRDFAFAAAVILGVLVYGYVERSSFTIPDFSFSNVSDTYAVRPIAKREFTVTDGDTIRLVGQPKGLRLVGFNTPETINAKCPEELTLGLRAKARLSELTETPDLTLERVRCSCPPGTEGTDECNYGRTCGILRVAGRDVGELLIAEELAVPFVCGSTRCPPTPRPWCGQ